MITRKLLDSYDDLLGAVEESLRERLQAALSAIDLTDREKAIGDVLAVMDAYCGSYCELSAELAASVYEAIRFEQLGDAGFTALRDSGYSADANAGAVRGIVFGASENAMQESIAGLLTERALYEIRRSAGSNTFANIKADKNRPRFARVPAVTPVSYKPWRKGYSHNKDVALHGTCSFCRMLASRGFVYYSAQSAGEFSHYHADCDCKIVPSWDRSGVEGYDPSEYRDEYYRTMEAHEPQHMTLAGRGYARMELGSGIDSVMGKTKEQWQAASKHAKDANRENTQAWARQAYAAKRLEQGKDYKPR